VAVVLTTILSAFVLLVLVDTTSFSFKVIISHQVLKVRSHLSLVVIFKFQLIVAFFIMFIFFCSQLTSKLYFKKSHVSLTQSVVFSNPISFQFKLETQTTSSIVSIFLFVVSIFIGDFVSSYFHCSSSFTCSFTILGEFCIDIFSKIALVFGHTLPSVSNQFSLCSWIILSVKA
jgi:hypothetical protein